MGKPPIMATRGSYVGLKRASLIHRANNSQVPGDVVVTPAFDFVNCFFSLLLEDQSCPAPVLCGLKAHRDAVNGKIARFSLLSGYRDVGINP